MKRPESSVQFDEIYEEYHNPQANEKKTIEQNRKKRIEENKKDFGI